MGTFYDFKIGGNYLALASVPKGKGGVMENQLTLRTYHIRNSEKCYRFRPEALINHAPYKKGIYEIVTFDDKQKPVVLYIGAAFEETIHDCLEAHLENKKAPMAKDLFSQYPNLYFDFIDEWNAVTEEDVKDVYWWLVKKYNPTFNFDKSEPIHSGRPGDIDVVEL
jgi:hypothetical protein